MYYRINKIKGINTQIEREYDAESIERKIERLLTSGEPIESISPLLYNERKEGIQPESDIRTDKMEIARQAMGNVSKSYIAKRQNYLQNKEPKKAEFEE